MSKLNTEQIDIDAIAEKALADDMALKAAKVEADASKAALKKALEAKGLLNPDFKGTDLVRVIVKAPMNFDKNKALALLTESEIAEYSSLDRALVEKNIAPNLYELMKSPGTISVTLQVAD